MSMGLKDIYDKTISAVEDIDEKLDSLSDADTAGKRKIGNDLVEAAKSDWEPYVKNTLEQMNGMSVEQRYGVYFAIQRELRKAFDKDASKFVADKIESLPKSEPLITEDEGKTLSKTRSELYGQLKSVVQLAIQIGECDEDNPWPLPKTRRGAFGKRGKRALTTYSWLLDGESVDGVNSLKTVSEHLGYAKVKDFSDALRSDAVATGVDTSAADFKPGIDTKTPPQEFTLTHSSGVVVTGFKSADAVDTSNGDDDEDEEDEDEDDDEE